jgi:hypothetical protein
MVAAAARFTRQENRKVRSSFLRARFLKRFPTPFFPDPFVFLPPAVISIRRLGGLRLDAWAWAHDLWPLHRSAEFQVMTVRVGEIDGLRRHLLVEQGPRDGNNSFPQDGRGPF